MSAFECAPGRGSEAGAGWAWTSASALEHEVWLLVRRGRAAAIRDELAQRPLPVHVVPIGMPPRLEALAGRLKLTLTAYYVVWQVLAWRTGAALHRTVRFDVGHHVTFATDSLPAGITRIHGLPVVWGPVGGSTRTAVGLYRWMGWRGRVEQVFREVALEIARRTWGRRVARRAAVVVASNKDVARTFADARVLITEPNVAVDPALMSGGRPAAPTTVTRLDAPRRAIYAGRLLPFKGIRLALRALSQPAAARWTLDLYGSGPERRPAERLTRRLGLVGRVTFHGDRPRAEVLAELTRADATLFLGFHDSTGWVVGEAVAVGCPVVCLDRGGPPEVVGHAGTVVPVRPGRDLPARIAAALAAVGGRNPPSERWDAGRLPALLASWYAIATRPTTPARAGVRAA